MNRPSYIGRKIAVFVLQ